MYTIKMNVPSVPRLPYIFYHNQLREGLFPVRDDNAKKTELQHFICVRYRNQNLFTVMPRTVN